MFKSIYMEKKWYVIYTRSRCEKKVDSILKKNNIESYCPLNKVMKQWSDRKKLVYEPLFNGYVFVRIAEHEHIAVRQLSTEIINFIYWLGKPAVIKDDEIQNISNFLNNYMNVTIEQHQLALNNKVKILSGPLIDREGIVTYLGCHKVKVILPSLGYSLIAETNIMNVRKIADPIVSHQMVS